MAENWQIFTAHVSLLFFCMDVYVIVYVASVAVVCLSKVSFVSLGPEFGPWTRRQVLLLPR